MHVVTMMGLDTFLRLSVLLGGSVFVADCLSQNAPAFIEIVNPLKSSVDQLPVSFAQDWPTWVLSSNDDDKGTGREAYTWTKIPNDGDYVNPVSFHCLWHPVDLRLPQLQIAVALHVRDGVPRHVLPALDLTLGVSAYRNRGLNSVPRAWRWMDVTAYLSGSRECTLELQTGSADDGDEVRWESIAKLTSVKDSIDFAFQALADDPPSELGSGSSVVHIVMNNGEQLAMPKPGNQLKLVMVEDGDDVTGSLDVEIVPTLAGSKSEYMPESYAGLFGDEECLSPAYIEFQNKKKNREY